MFLLEVYRGYDKMHMRGGKVMQENSIKNEYQEMLEFICELKNSALEQYDILLSEKKELEYKRRQQEFVLEEKEKKKIPNLSMFSPLATENSDECDVADKDELNQIVQQLEDAEHKLEKQKNICSSLERLKKYFSEMEPKNNSFTDYSVKLLETQEMDRNRISRDLHDSTVQSLTSLGHKLEYCSKLVDRDPIKVKLELQSMIDVNKEIINDMREIIYDLRPMSLNNIGLVSTVEAYCLHLRRNDNLNIIFKTEGEERELSSIISVTLYRIIQEACNNAIRHARAKRIIVCISFLEKTIKISIEDNGVGFDINEVENRVKEDILHGFGLSTMRERTRLLSGSFFIDTKPGAGTKIHITVPADYTSREGVYYE